MNKFCCKCGKSETEGEIIDSFCLDCFHEEFPLIQGLPEKKLILTQCKLCGDILYHGKWRGASENIKTAIYEIIDEFIAKAKKVRGTRRVAISDFKEPTPEEPQKQEVKVIFEGSPREDVPVYQQELEFELVTNIGVCDRCAKLARGYFESIIQIRSDRRAITKREQIQISELIRQKKAERLKGDKMAYISKVVDKAKGGIDLYIGSEEFAKALARFLANELAASVEYSTKLKSMKDGKPIYQSTYCVRVPYFEVGDIVEYRGCPHQIVNINFGRVEIFNLRTQETKTLSLKESHPDYLHVLKKQDQFQIYIVVAIQPPNVSIMNKVTFETIDIDIGVLYQEHHEGDEILMVELPEGLFECRKF